MKFKRRIAAGLLITVILTGISVLLLRQPTAPIPPPVVNESSRAANSLPAVTVQITNSSTWPPARASHRDSQRMTPLQVMKEILDLSDEQAEKLGPILREQQRQLAAFRRETSLSRQQRIAKLKEMRETNDAHLKTVLTPEQIEKWRKGGLNLQAALQEAANPP
jgi:Spy/CpxP family protein refolding chaperone